MQREVCARGALCQQQRRWIHDGRQSLGGQCSFNLVSRCAQSLLSFVQGNRGALEQELRAADESAERISRAQVGRKPHSTLAHLTGPWTERTVPTCLWGVHAHAGED